MARRIFIAFLGVGNPKTPEAPYDTVAYAWEGRPSRRTMFAQAATAEHLGPFDQIAILCTKDSRQLRPRLKAELQQLPDFIKDSITDLPDDLPTEMTAENQWTWFEQLLDVVQDGDHVTFDFTHGMRAVPIIFSSAIGFLRRARAITLEHAVYGWYDRENTSGLHPLVELREFFVINDWAEAVSRLAEDADARALARLANENRGIAALRPLADPELIEALNSATATLRNVDVNNVGRDVRAALKIVARHRDSASGSARLLLDLVDNKFTTLAIDCGGRYDANYFQLQLAVIDALVEHRLFMQAATAMRECVGSLGMLGLTGKYDKPMKNDEGRQNRPRFADTFVNMLQYERDKWRFDETDPKCGVPHLRPWLDHLAGLGIEAELRAFVPDLIKLRNGFDHAWTSKKSAEPDIDERCRVYQRALTTTVLAALEARSAYPPPA